MQETECMCTAVFCGHALREQCPRPIFIFLKVASGTSNTSFGSEIRIGICEMCWFNLQRYIPGFFGSALPWDKAG